MCADVPIYIKLKGFFYIDYMHQTTQNRIEITK